MTKLLITNFLAILIFGILVPKTILSQNITIEKMKISKKNNAVHKLVRKLPSEIVETSGLAYFNETLWTHNDGNNPAVLYQMNMNNGKVQKRVHLKNVQNTDWEELAQDENFVYVGDFGNNMGNRRMFLIHKVAKSVMLQNNQNIETEATSIEYTYDDLQTDTVLKPYSHSFDCEAFIVKDGEFHIFSKNWGDKHCNHYTLPIDGSSKVAKYHSTFDSEGVITGATYNPDENILVLSGYQWLKRRIRPFLWVFSEFENNDFFFGKVIKLNFPYQIKQIEAVEYIGNKTYLYSNEGIKKFITISKPRLYELKIEINEE